MFFSIPVCTFSLIPTAVGAGAIDISVSICSYSLEASFVICKDSSHSDNTSILFVLLKLVLVSLYSLYYTCFVPNRQLCLVLSICTFLARWAHRCFTKCYNLKLELRLHLGKDLRMDKGCLELVKRKDYRVVFTLYTDIPWGKCLLYMSQTSHSP